MKKWRLKFYGDMKMIELNSVATQIVELYGNWKKLKTENIVWISAKKKPQIGVQHKPALQIATHSTK